MPVQQAPCEKCRKFFARFYCNLRSGECDCPKCQGFCECVQSPPAMTFETFDAWWDYAHHAPYWHNVEKRQAQDIWNIAQANR